MRSSRPNAGTALIAIGTAALLVPVLLALLVLPGTLHDTRELLVWGRFFPLTTFKHPPMMAWVGGLVDALLAPTGFWAILTGQVLNAIGIAYLYATLRLVVERERALFFAFLFAVSIYFQVAPLSYALNADILQVPVWLAIVYHAMRAAESDRALHWILLAVWAAVAVLVKYSAALLFLALVAATLVVPSYRGVWRNWRLYAATLLGLLLVAPHFVALLTDDLAIQHAESYVAFDAPLISRLSSLGGFVGGVLLYLTPGWIVILVGLYRREFAWSAPQGDVQVAQRRRFLVSLLLASLAALAAFILVAGLRFYDRMGAPFFGLIALALLPFVTIDGSRWAATRRRVLVTAAAIVATVTTVSTLVYGVFSSHDYLQEPLDEATTILRESWDERFTCGPAYVLGDRPSAHGLALFGDRRPIGVPVKEVALVAWFDRDFLERDGAMVVFRDAVPAELLAEHLPGIEIGETETLTLPLMRTMSGGEVTYHYFFVAPRDCAR